MEYWSIGVLNFFLDNIFFFGKISGRGGKYEKFIKRDLFGSFGNIPV
jgi:hypothetical protein